MSDKELYLEVIEELKTIRHKALWKKASALAKGDPNETRSKYIALRVEMLKDDGDISVKNQQDSELLKLVPKLITIVVIVAAVVGLYFLMSPYQNCKRNAWDQAPMSFQTVTRNRAIAKCSQITDW